MTWNPNPFADAVFEILRIVRNIDTKVNLMSEQQAELNTDVANLVAALTAIEAEIASLKAANPAVDFTGLEAAIATAQGLAPAPAAPPAS
jgi:peptidoglycan hydrolase CwlO-like protein